VSVSRSFFLSSFPFVSAYNIIYTKNKIHILDKNKLNLKKVGNFLNIDELGAKNFVIFLIPTLMTYIHITSVIN
jgi:hypothetical protein